jgi:hypothetical protein
MPHLYRGNWPHDGSKAPKFEDDEAVVIEMDRGHSWGPQKAMYHVAADLEDVEKRLEKYVAQMAKAVLNDVVIAKVEGGEDLKGWPIGAVAKVKSFSCTLELEYTDQKATKKKRKSREKLEE